MIIALGIRRWSAPWLRMVGTIDADESRRVEALGSHSAEKNVENTLGKNYNCLNLVVYFLNFDIICWLLHYCLICCLIFMFLMENMFWGFLDAKPCRTMMKLPQKVSFGPEACEIGPEVWFLASGFCLLRLGEPSGGNWGNPNSLPQVTALQDFV